MNPINPLIDAAPEDLSKEEIERYSRHLILPEVGVEGQRRLRDARVLLIGAGGLGSPLAMYLAAAGIGHIGIVDADVVDVSNLQRQVIHHTEDVGQTKTASARRAIEGINPNVEVKTFDTFITSKNALELIEPYDLVIDGTDNFPTRYCVNDACVLLGKPNIYGSIFRFEGQASVFWAKHGPCYRCLYPEPPAPGLVPSCAEGGVLGVLPGIIGCIQATEAVKLILGQGDSLLGRLLLFDALRMQFRELKLRKDPNCPVCGEHPTVTELIDYEVFCGIPQAAAAKPQAASGELVSVEALRDELTAGVELTLLDVREPYEFKLCQLSQSVEMPLGEVPHRFAELNSDDSIVIYCRSGVRSRNAQLFLQKKGFTRVRNLTGGILDWAAKIDPSMPRY
ncbi:MAG: molybdopterin/thiamine biosynthesis adenylyltransferase/rhodanese-related sulfurtransferase [Kiritimatiellia bacterium]|jgi:molybdopterin/thiamine biosynthesis adenylyltransferase/rhodanese-related sulfurtransferase